MPISVPNCIEKNRKYKHNTAKKFLWRKAQIDMTWETDSVGIICILGTLHDCNISVHCL